MPAAAIRLIDDSTRVAPRPGRSETTRRLLRVVIVALTAIAVAQVGFYLAIKPRLAIGSIAVVTDLRVSDSELQRMAGVAVGDRFAAVNLETVRQRLLAFPEVATASVSRRFPDALLLEVQAREPLLALIATTPDGATVPFTVDREGRVYRAGLPQMKGDLVVLSGLQATAADLGGLLGDGLLPLVADLDFLHQEQVELSMLISQVQIIPRDGSPMPSVTTAGGVDALVYTIGYSTPLYFSDHLDADALTEGLLVLDTLTRTGQLQSVSHIDMRAGPPVLVRAAE